MTRGSCEEAKGTKQPHPDSIRKAVCGFANAQGGYLILGGERQNGAWQLLGVQFSHPEPATWLSSFIAPNGITPVPPFDAKPFVLNEERQAVVVRVEPVSRPPCMTASGQVFQRVSGQDAAGDRPARSRRLGRGRRAGAARDR